MSEEILSQDEVDALLKGVTGEEDTPVVEEGSDGIRPYNLAKQERIVRGRMPTLEIINERFARYLRVALYNFTRRNPEISVGQVKVAKYGEFMRNLVVPTNINICHMRPMRGMCLFIFDPTLVFLTVDNLFGGDGRFHTRIEGRDFTATEQRIIQRMLEQVLECYERSWKPVFPASFEYVRSEINTQFANIATPNEVVVTTTFQIEIGSGTGDLHICLPYSMIEPVRDLLTSSLQGEAMAVDQRWIRMLRDQLTETEVEMVATLASRNIRVDELIGIQKGDIIPIDIAEVVTATVDNVPVLEARFGVHQGRYALKVERVINRVDDDPTKEKQHG
ncbi:MAG: flagellar motor switch protein FliM [Pseudomonadota bacterium]|nr:flagellar motor switch protein FliM [Pseudomonadota bacterium]